jgi:hypothetical protein
MFISRPCIVAAAILASFCIVPGAFADPLHQFAKQDAYWHHGSGWVYPRTVGGLQLQGSPAQLDGNDDVTAEYATELNGARRTAVVDVYYPNSAAVGAKLATAKAAVEARVNAKKAGEPGVCESSHSEDTFAIGEHPEIVGVKVTFEPKSAAECIQSALYFFRTPDWVITVRTTSRAADEAAAKAMDEFVRALRWDTLGTDPFLQDASP